MTRTYGINISVTVSGNTEQECDRAAFYYKEVFRTKLHNQLKAKKMYQDLVKYEVELPNLLPEENDPGEKKTCCGVFNDWSPNAALSDLSANDTKRLHL